MIVMNYPENFMLNKSFTWCFSMVTHERTIKAHFALSHEMYFLVMPNKQICMLQIIALCQVIFFFVY